MNLQRTIICLFLNFMIVMSVHGMCAKSLNTLLRSNPKRVHFELTKEEIAKRSSLILGDQHNSVSRQVLEFAEYNIDQIDQARTIISYGTELMGSVLKSILKYSKLFPTDEFTANPYELSLYRRSISAVYLDGLFSTSEGSAELAIKSDDHFSDIQRRVYEDGLRSKIKVSRYTPFGTLTDDSQFLTAGIMAASGSVGRETGSFTNSYLSQWKMFQEHDVWRNLGKRMKAYLNSGRLYGDLSGPFTTGDILRVFPFIYRSQEIEVVINEFLYYAERMNLNSEQVNSSISFLRAVHASLSGKPASEINAQIDRMIKINYEDSQLGDVLEAIKLHLVKENNFSAYIETVSETSKDFDTLAFIGALFARKKFDAIVNQSQFDFNNPSLNAFIDLMTSFSFSRRGDYDTNGEIFGPYHSFISEEYYQNELLQLIRSNTL